MSAFQDLRGFSYPLTALLEKRRWELEHCQQALGRAQAQARTMKRVLAALRDRVQSQHEQLSNGLQQHLRPDWHRQSLLYLTAQRARVAELARDMKQQNYEVQRLHRQCLRMHAGIKALEEHRQALLVEYLQEQRRYTETEMDKAWITRSVWLSGSTKSRSRRMK